MKLWVPAAFSEVPSPQLMLDEEGLGEWFGKALGQTFTEADHFLKQKLWEGRDLGTLAFQGTVCT
jgi:hypothetical protein